MSGFLDPRFVAVHLTTVSPAQVRVMIDADEVLVSPAGITCVMASPR